jgi:predicted RNA-binding Zn-ribbon protein involved in translation (DUF1610 family)
MSESSEYSDFVCERCGMVSRFRVVTMKSFYKGNAPNCPACSRPLLPAEKPAEKTAEKAS